MRSRRTPTRSLSAGTSAGGGGTSTVVLAVAGIDPPNVYQWSNSTLLSVYGTGFTSTSIIKINNSNQTTTYVSAQKLTCVIPAAETAGSILQTAGTLSVGVDASSGVPFVIDPYSWDTYIQPSAIFDPLSRITIATGVLSWLESVGFPSRQLVATAFPNTQPTYISSINIFNNHPGVVFDGLSNYMIGIVTTGTNGIFIGGDGFEFFNVVSPNSIWLSIGAETTTLVSKHVVWSGNAGTPALAFSSDNSNSIHFGLGTSSTSYKLLTKTSVALSTAIITNGSCIHDVFRFRTAFGSFTSSITTTISENGSNNNNNQLRIGHRIQGTVTDGRSAMTLGHMVFYNTQLPDIHSDRLYRKLKVYYNL